MRDRKITIPKRRVYTQDSAVFVPDTVLTEVLDTDRLVAYRGARWGRIVYRNGEPIGFTEVRDREET